MAVSPDGKLLAIGGDGVTLLNLADGSDRTIAIPSGAAPLGLVWVAGDSTGDLRVADLAASAQGAFLPPAPPGSGWVLVVGLLIPLGFCLLASLATLQNLGMMGL